MNQGRCRVTRSRAPRVKPPNALTQFESRLRGPWLTVSQGRCRVTRSRAPRVKPPNALTQFESRLRGPWPRRSNHHATKNCAPACTALQPQQAASTAECPKALRAGALCGVETCSGFVQFLRAGCFCCRTYVLCCSIPACWRALLGRKYLQL